MPLINQPNFNIDASNLTANPYFGYKQAHSRTQSLQISGVRTIDKYRYWDSTYTGSLGYRSVFSYGFFPAIEDGHPDDSPPVYQSAFPEYGISEDDSLTQTLPDAWMGFVVVQGSLVNVTDYFV